MCDINAYILKEGEQELVMENVDEVLVMGNETKLFNIFGEVKTFQAIITAFNNSQKKIVLTPLA